MAHRFWRILGHANGGGNFTAILKEVTFLNKGSIVSVGGLAFADTTYNSTYVPAKAFDQDPLTYWASEQHSPFPYYIGYEFPTETQVDRLKIQAQTGDRAPTEFEIQYSDDGTNWTTTDNGIVTSTDWVDDEIREFLVTVIPTGGTGSSKVSGVIQIDGTPAQRIVRAFSYDTEVHQVDGIEINASLTLGHATSDPDTGEYTIDLLGGYGNEIFVVAFDDYGAGFQPNLALAVGDRIHPTTPNGYVWECVGAGTLPSEEPMWVMDIETAQLYGTASMIARPFYRPMVHGPVMPEVVELDPEP